MPSSVLRARGQVTIPTEIRTAVGLQEGDPIEVELTPEGILLRPQKIIDAAQAWFWTAEWQAGEREASADIRAGRVTRHVGLDALLEGLEGAGRARRRPPPTRAGRRRAR